MDNSFKFKDIEDKIDYLQQFKKLIDNFAGAKPEKSSHEEIINSRVDLLLFQTEYSFLINELVFEIKFINKYFEDLPEKIKDFFNDFKNSMYSRKFVIVEDKIKETEEGYLESKREDFLKSPQFEQMKQFLENSSQ